MLCVPMARHPVSKELRQQLCRSLNSVVKRPLSSATIGPYRPTASIAPRPATAANLSPPLTPPPPQHPHSRPHRPPPSLNLRLRHSQQGPQVFRGDAKLVGLFGRLLMRWQQAVDAGLGLVRFLEAAEL